VTVLAFCFNVFRYFTECEVISLTLKKLDTYPTQTDSNPHRQLTYSTWGLVPIFCPVIQVQTKKDLWVFINWVFHKYFKNSAVALLLDREFVVSNNLHCNLHCGVRDSAAQVEDDV